ncbi:MAG: ABC transporter ATP-binding protein [Phormidium sp. BM_Day4_Bin.17]|nr:ABC transporter ATP-binding protein [Phormidium sp. BM_Day4_Bin.17]UCJ13056.1 MAG: ABC transporter ATP-binding protein/permease [Phormidium sp. PBR-2020]
MTVTPLDRPKARPKVNDWRLFLRLTPYAKRNQKLLWIVLALLPPLALAGSVQPVLVGQTISFIRQEPTYFFLEGLTLSQGITLLVTLLLFTMVVRAILDGIQGFLVQKVGQRMTMQIRNDLFERVTSLSSSFFDRTPVGRLITRLTSDVDALGDVFSTGAIGIVSDLATILVLILVMFTVQWELALMLLLMLIPTAAIVIYFQQQFRKANYRAREELSRLNSNFQENIVGINIVQLFRRERYNAEAFRSINQDYISAVDRTIFHDSAVSATLEWVSLIAIAGVLWLGGLRVIEGEMNFGLLASFILFAQRLFDPLRQFADKFTSLQSGFTAVERISDLLDEPIDIQDPAGIDTRSIEPGHSGEIRFENVSFGYKPDEYVLHNLNFTIHRGEKVAIVGPTGAGKSSMIRLLCRLYEPQQGRILIDGIDVRDLRQAELRQHVGVILQDGFVFAGDVKSNIALGEHYDFETIQAAAEQTNVSQFIEQLPEGYNTQLRERGTNLSGGEKQLLAFARVAVRNPKIMVLDEATANLDVKTEAWIQEALDRLLERRTAIIIAHRLSTIRNVDRILVLKRGELVESGSHEELLQQNGLYAGLYKLQLLES